MELELGIKLARVADEFTSDFQISKDHAGPLFFSRETEAMFILTSHLHGYRRGNIKIDINEDGTLITVSGERQVKETVIVGWKVHKKDTETTAFKKAFKIPANVNLDMIKAKYNDDESTLTISMPKKVKGIQGISVEEVKEVAELAREGSGSLQIWDEKVAKNETSDQENNEITKSGEPEDSGENEVTQEEMPKKETKSVLGSEAGGDRLQDEVHGFHGKVVTEETNSLPSEQSKVPRVETDMPKQELKNENTEDDTRERIEPKIDLGTMHVKNEAQNENEEILDKESERHTKEEEVQEAEAGRGEEGVPKQGSKRCKMCTPIVAAGSAILLSLVVFVIHVTRSKNQTRKRKD
ncbi:uncharacterized protein [Primulina huaijiensis]|uniref:uncharacterized protein n=1 Tax=Primulina huaijiensis TaxID=1492673 RepID=UPI003CC75E89